MIVVVTIVIVLISILIPLVAKARRSARVARTRRDLETIATALEAYKQSNNGQYPQVAAYPKPYSPAVANSIMNVDAVPMFTDNGAHALYTALMLRNNVRVTRMANGGGVTVGGSAPYGPFLDSGKIKVSSDMGQPWQNDTKYTGNVFVCDGEGRPILYAPAYPLPLQYTKTSAAAPSAMYVGDSVNIPATPRMFDIQAIPAQVPDPTGATWITPFTDRRSSPTYTTPLTVMRALMGDTTGAGNQGDGIIDTTAGETAATTGPYILWAAGEDGYFGLDGDGKSDDVTNFTFPAQFQP
jgi:type II secretory pathway pseudopilin PulG